MRLAIIGCRGYPSTYGGFETMVRNLAPWLASRGHDVTVYCRGGRARTEEHDGVLCRYTRGADRSSLSTLSYGLTAALDARTRDLDAALVVNVANGFYLPVLRRAGIPTAVNVDGLEWERAKWNRFGRWVFARSARLTARFADAIVVDSRAIGEFWSARFGRSSSYIPYGADVTGPRSIDRIKSLGLERDGYVLAVCRIVPENNVQLLVEATRLMKNSVPVVVVGSAPHENDATQALDSAVAAGDVRAVGHVDDQDLLRDLWSNASVYFHGHSVGGTNPALLEALGSGCPVIAFDSVFNREVLGDSYPYLFENPRSAATMLDHLLDDASERERLRAQGQRAVSDRFRWGDVCEAYEGVLTDLGRARRTRRGSAN